MGEGEAGGDEEQSRVGLLASLETDVNVMG